MQVFRYHTSMMRIHPLLSSTAGVYEVQMGGVITTGAIEHLRPLMLQAVRHVPALVVRMEVAVNAVYAYPPITPELFPADGPLEVLVVRPSHYDAWRARARDLASTGMQRYVFLEDQYPAACFFADLLARRRLAQPESEDSGPAPLEGFRA